jgi:hypothetical protein
MKKTTVIAGFVLLLHAPANLFSQRPSEIVKWNTSVTRSTAASATVALSASIQDGWHVYALSQPAGGPTPLKISFPAGTPYALQSPVAEGKVTRHNDPNFKMETVYYLDAIRLNVMVKKDGVITANTVPVDVRFQACNDRLCLPPYTTHLTADLKGK